jgi:uncharacterized protein YbjT (DUF2867 family)
VHGIEGGTRGGCPRRNPRERPPRTWRVTDTTPDTLVTGATGYVGGRLLDSLRARGAHLRALARDPGRARLPTDVEVACGDVVSGEGLAPALAGIRTAYYLVHSMGRGARERDFAARDRRAAEHFGRAAATAGVERIVYLGGLGREDGDHSEHLRSRTEVAEILAGHVPTAHARAAMIIGAGSSSFLVLRHLVERLPAMIVPRWLETRSQPIAVEDVVAALAALGRRTELTGSVELGGADVLSYREMMDRFADITGRRRRPVVGVPVLTPRLSSYWIAAVTPVELGLVRPLVDGLRSEMLVEHQPPAGVNDNPLGFDDAVRAALEAPA